MRIFALCACAALSACAATIPPVEVTRFHVDQPMTPAAIAILPAPGGDTQGLEFRTYGAAVAKQLAALGYLEASDLKSPFIAEVDYTRGTRTDVARRSPFSIGIGTGSYGRGGGFGIGTSFGVGGGGTRDTVTTRLSVRIKARVDGKPVWEGKAQTSAPANAPAAQPGLAAEKLAAALFKGFPGKSGETISVP